MSAGRLRKSDYISIQKRISEYQNKLYDLNRHINSDKKSAIFQGSASPSARKRGQNSSTQRVAHETCVSMPFSRAESVVEVRGNADSIERARQHSIGVDNTRGSIDLSAVKNSAERKLCGT